jgi:hypothetical protein
MKISSDQKADIVRRIQVKNPDGTWAEKYGALAEEFGVSRCLISHIAKHVPSRFWQGTRVSGIAAQGPLFVGLTVV